MAIDGVRSAADIQAQAAAAAVPDDALDRDTFLRLLTTQLQNQDPTNPQDSQQFVAQLAQFSSLEQLMNANDALGTMHMALMSLNHASMTSLLGKDVTALGDGFHYDGEGAVELGYIADVDVEDATLTVKDASGKVVWSGPVGSLAQGEGTVTFAGKDQSGNWLDEGDYTFAITGTDANGEPLDVTELVTGTVDGMSYDSGTPIPSVDGVDISLADILRVHSPKEEEE